MGHLVRMRDWVILYGYTTIQVRVKFLRADTRLISRRLIGGEKRLTPFLDGGRSYFSRYWSCLKPFILQSARRFAQKSSNYRR